MSKIEEQRELAHELVDNNDMFILILQDSNGKSQMIDSNMSYTERFGLLEQGKLVLDKTFKSTIEEEGGTSDGED